MTPMRTLGKIARRLRLTPDVIAIMATYWGIPLAIVVGYFTQLRGAMAAGVPPLEFFSIYLSQVSIALTPYSIPLLSILTIYLYLHVVLIPLAISAAHGDARTHRGLHAVASLLLDASLFLRAWWCGLDTDRTHPTADPTTSPLRLSTLGGLPKHLSTGWSSGTNPLVIYG